MNVKAKVSVDDGREHGQGLAVRVTLTVDDGGGEA